MGFPKTMPHRSPKTIPNHTKEENRLTPFSVVLAAFRAVVTHRLCPTLSDSAVERIPTGTNHRNVRKRARGDVPGIYISCMPLYCALA